MRKIATLCITIVVAISCTKNETATVSQKYTPSQFEQVGRIHSQGLDFVITSLNQKTFSVNQRANNKRNLSEILVENEKAAFAFVKQQMPNLTADQEKLLSDNFKVITQKGIDYVSKMRANGYSAKVAVDELSNSIINDVSKYLSAGQNEKLLLVINAINTQSSNIDLLMRSLDDIESQVYSLSTEEQPVIFSAISIARSSSQYWKANYDSWQQQINKMVSDSNGQLIGGKLETVNGGAVAVCDVGCGALMALGCFLSGPVGWGFSVTAVGGAAVVGSGIAAAIM